MNEIVIQQQFQYLIERNIIYRYQNSDSTSYQLLHFYSNGFLKEKLSKMILNDFKNCSPHSMTQIRTLIFSIKYELSDLLKINSNIFEVMITECLLMKGKANQFGEMIIQIMFKKGIEKYISIVNEKKEKWEREGKINDYTKKHIEIPN